MSSAERWGRIEELFHAALTLPVDERATLLAAERDETLRAEVASLLAAHEEPGSFRETAASELAAEMVSEPPAPTTSSDSAAASGPVRPPPRPERIGPYRLLEVVGQGGMGTVYLAEQSEPLPRQVALKLMHWGGADGETVRRFELERQALARMSHPAVAQVLDAGATEHGQPYFVLEYIPGTPITEFCDARRIGLRRRLQLFATVCDGVRHAHEKGILHRDLKPGNILVRDARGGPLPKIIDFGIAKALEPWSEKAASATATRLRVGSPLYMSPEAIEGGGRAVDTRSDVYSLGVVLYELLVGVRPLEKSPLSSGGLADALTGDLPRPSQRLRALSPEERQEIATRRGIGERGLLRALRGELDWIVLRTLAREPSRRYGSPAELEADIERYLAQEPVQARPPGLLYRGRKALRRHAMAAIAASLVLVALVSGIVSTTLQARRARSEATAARQVSDFLVELFEVSDPYQARGEEVTARELLERGRARLERRLADQPEIRARLARTVGTVYHHLGLHDQAEPLLVEALELQRRIYGDRHLEVAESLVELAKLRQSEGRWEAAEEHLRRALAVRLELLGESHLEVASTLDELSYTLRRRGRFEEAESLVRQALAMYRTGLGGDDDLALALATDSLASLLADRGDDAEAEPLFREALEMKRRLHPQGHISVVNGLNHLSAVLARGGKHGEAEALLQEALTLSRRLFGEEHPLVASVLDRLGSARFHRGELLEAEELLRRALEMRQQVLGEDHAEVSASLNNLAVALRQQGKYAAAEALLRQSLERDRRNFGPTHPHVANGLDNLGTVVMRDRGCLEAEPILREALGVYGLAFPQGHPRAASIGCRLAQCLAERREQAEAKKLLERSLEYLRGSDASSLLLSECSEGARQVDDG